MVLGGVDGGSGFNLGCGFHRQLPAQLGQTVIEGGGVLRLPDFDRLLEDDVPRVHIPDHALNGNAGYPLPVEDGPVDGGGAPVLGQQGGVDVDAPPGGQGKDLIGEETAIGRHHNQLRVQLLQNGQGGPVPQCLGLIDGDAVDQGPLLHRGGLELIVVPAYRPVRLTEHTRQLMSGPHQPLQRGDCKLRGAHEDDSHLLLLLLRFAFSSFSSWDMISSSSSAVYSRSACSSYICPSRCSSSWQKHRAAMSSPSVSNQLPYRSWARTLTQLGRFTFPHMPGRDRQPSQPSCSPSWARISGLTSSIISSLSGSGTTITARRRIPICGAARPTPLASVNVSRRSSSRSASLSSNRVTG